MGEILALLAKKKNRITSDEWLIQVHHTLMKEYGWIPLDKFKLLSAQMVNDLINEINKDREAEKKSIKGRGKK